MRRLEVFLEVNFKNLEELEMEVEAFVIFVG
jgi:hypothetical protein